MAATGEWRDELEKWRHSRGLDSFRFVCYRVALTTVPPNRAYNGSLLANCSISLAGPTIVACYLEELRLPTDESHRIRNKGRKVPLGLSGR